MDSIASYVINLDRRHERWLCVKEELMRNGFSPQRISAIDNGWKGCRDSHLYVLNLTTNQNSFFVFEDDVEFIGDAKLISKAIKQLPKDWDCLYLGASPQELQERISDNLFRISKSWCMHSILWHNRKGGAIEYMLANRKDIGKIDVFMANKVMPKFNCFLIYPIICTQKETNTSDTCTRSDVSTIKRNYDKYCSI